MEQGGNESRDYGHARSSALVLSQTLREEKNQDSWLLSGKPKSHNSSIDCTL